MKKFILHIYLILFTAIFLFCQSAFAFSVPINNASFENSSAAEETDGFGNRYTRSTIDGWEYSGNTEWGIWSPIDNGMFYTDPVPDGEYIGYLNDGSIFQSLDWVVAANNIFTVSLDIGNRMDDVPFPDAYGVELWAGDTLLVSNGSIVPGEGLFSTLTMDYTVLEGDSIIGSMLGIRIFSEGVQLNFDNLHISNDHIDQPAAVPEPTTVILLGSGLIGLAGFRKKLFKKSA